MKSGFCIKYLPIFLQAMHNLFFYNFEIVGLPMCLWSFEAQTMWRCGAERNTPGEEIEK
jgi:hypothetical protein